MCRYLSLVLLITSLFLVNSSCSNKSQTLSEQGNCNGVSTYSIMNKWKLQEAGKSADALEYDFQVLMFEPGVYSCLTQVVSKVEGPAVFKAVYTHDVDQREISFSYLQVAGGAPYSSGGESGVKYAFSGQCADTKMTLTYDDGRTEVYKIYSMGTQANDCRIQ